MKKKTENKNKKQKKTVATTKKGKSTGKTTSKTTKNSPKTVKGKQTSCKNTSSKGKTTKKVEKKTTNVPKKATTPKNNVAKPQKKSTPKTESRKKPIYKKTTDKVGDVLVNGAGVKYKITNEKLEFLNGYNDGKQKIRILEITPEKRTGLQPFETSDTNIKYYRDKKILRRITSKR